MKSWHASAILAILVTAIALGVGVFVYFYLLSAPDAAAVSQRFLDSVAEARYEDAYDDTTPDFRAATPLESFRTSLEGVGLSGFRSAEWQDRNTTGSRTTLRGDLRLEDGSALPATIIAVRGRNAWAIHSLELRPAGAEADPIHLGVERPPPPGDEERKALVEHTLLAFNDAVGSNDFTTFHATLARQFRERYGPADIQEAFQSFIDREIDIAPIRRYEPVYEEGTEPGRAAEDGRLRLKGRYPTRPSEVSFDLVYVWEEGAWRLFEINLRVQPADQQ